MFFFFSFVVVFILYFKKDYETKFNMLQELMKGNMKGLDFSEIRRQEVVRYLDNVATIADTDFKRKVDARVNQMNIDLEAREQFERKVLEVDDYYNGIINVRVGGSKILKESLKKMFKF